MKRKDVVRFIRPGFDELTAAEIFLQVVEVRGFSRAAKLVGRSTSTLPPPVAPPHPQRRAARPAPAAAPPPRGGRPVPEPRRAPARGAPRGARRGGRADRGRAARAPAGVDAGVGRRAADRAPPAGAAPPLLRAAARDRS